MESFLTISGDSTAEYTEKRSRFIATLHHISSEDEALAFIENMRSEYWDARHNVFAYSVGNGLKRFSDDGEPHGTAGKPILDIIVGSKLTDVVIVVTRYFGGVLLGTGGLVRAYSKSARDAVESADIVRMTPCTSFSTVCEYTDHGKLTNLISLYGGVIEDTVFESNVRLSYYLQNENCNEYLNKLSEAFSARIVANTECEKMLPISENKL